MTLYSIATGTEARIFVVKYFTGCLGRNSIPQLSVPNMADYIDDFLMGLDGSAIRSEIASKSKGYSAY